MVAVAFACLPLFRTGYSISRANGAVFFGSYVLYIVWTVMKATESPLLRAFNGLLAQIVIPALIVGFVVTLVAALGREAKGTS